MVEFDLPKENSSIIKVIGVGGGGSNAVNHMYNQGIIGVDFIVCNTDRQALDISPVPFKIQLGPSLTEGRGAGALPEVGMNAANENIEEIRELLSKGTKMVFVTAGLGGGTGTGAAPVIAQVAKDLGILTVGIVTVPFNFEGKKRRQQAEDGLEKMRQNVDTLLVINNERLYQISKNCTISQAFGMADDILTVAAKGIAELISVTGYINVDFNDVNTVMRNSGHAIMGSAHAEGEDRALVAIKSALNSPLLNDNNINGARYVLLNITYGSAELTMDEINVITDYIQNEAGTNAEVIWGHGLDNSLGESLNITLIATGFSTAATPVHGLEKPIEAKMIDLEGDSKTEISSPLANPVSSDLESSSEPVVSNMADEFQPTSILTPEVEINDSTVVYELTDNADEVSNNLEDLETANNLGEKETDTIHSEVEFDWDVTSETSEQSDLFSDENAISSENTNSVDSESDSESNPMIQYELEDETDFTTPIPRSKPNQEEHLLKSQERITRIKEYTAKLKMADGIIDFEKEPAYVRRNIHLSGDGDKTEKQVSKFGLSDDVNGTTRLTGNSFLHDNVD
ncbi:MAG: cell division protein FtsZ [Bacteroidota bacterium]